MKKENSNKIVLEVKSLKKYFPIEKGFWKRIIGWIKAVDEVNFYIRQGETLGLVGESGCGKTTLGKCILRAIEPTEGNILFRLNGDMIDLTKLDKESLRGMRRYAQMVFQDPYGSLDPRMSILDIIGEPLVVNKIARGEELKKKVKSLMEVVELNPEYLGRYPHAFSGGQRQRIAIARALAPNPKFIVLDEPVSALDVSVQAQILNLFQDLQEKFNLTSLFITHDLSVIEHISNRVAVMYVGKTVEMAKTKELFLNPKHPYTEAFLSAVPKPDPHLRMKRIILPGEVASPANPPSGCYFHPRCKYAKELCRKESPKLEEISPGHYVSCHFAKELSLQGIIFKEKPPKC